MKIHVDRTETKQRYPALMETDDGLIVLFSAEGCGTVIVPGTSSCNHGTGEHRDHWDMDLFQQFTGSITISDG